jgi:hypothetical protein
MSVVSRVGSMGACALILGATACSLVLDDLAVTCTPGLDDCAALNRKEGVDASAAGDCLVYQCRADRRGCEKKMRDLDEDGFPDKNTCAGMWKGDLDCNDEAKLTYPDAGESCDERDNDCDGWIDEGKLSADTLEAPDSTALKGVSAMADLNLSTLRGDAAWLALSARTGDAVMTRLLAPSSPDLVFPMDNDTCNGTCTMWEVAAAGSEQLLLAVGVSTRGCGAGQLRVGVTDGAGTRALTWDGLCLGCEDRTLKAPTSNLSLGVDRSGDRKCSVSGEQEGASAPSVGLLRNAGGHAQEALALWRAGPANGGAWPLVGMPVTFVRSVPDQERVVSAQGPALEGAPSASSHAFGDTRAAGSEPALIQPWRGPRQSGYLVGFDSAEGVELAFVPAAVSPGFSEVYSLPIRAVGGAHSIALAFTAREQETAPPGSEITLVWRSDTGDGLLLARIGFDPAFDPPLTLLSCGRVYESHQLLEGPTLLYHVAGFAEESAARGGGFFLTWVERDGVDSRLMGARLDEAAAASDTSCRKSVSRTLREDPFPLGETSSGAHPFTFVGVDQTPRYGFITKGTEQRLNIGSLRCQPE